MTENATVILENRAVLTEMCGANDRNLEVIEQLLGARIVTRGNELYLESEVDETGRLFLRLLEELEQHLRVGVRLSPELIRAVFSAVSTGDNNQGQLLRATALDMPGGGKTVFPRTFPQAEYLKAIQDFEMVFSVGPAGTGKTYLAVAAALIEVITRRKRKLVLTRPVVEAGESLGFLPGDLAQKINPYLRPLYDAMEDLVSPETVHKLEAQGAIEIAPLAYMRGRSLSNCFVILDEAQNTTREQMKMFLTRLGEGSRAVITGDITQIDLPRSKNSGLIHALQVLESVDQIALRYLTSRDVVRSPLVQRIVEAYERDSAEM